MQSNSVNYYITIKKYSTIKFSFLLQSKTQSFERTKTGFTIQNVIWLFFFINSRLILTWTGICCRVNVHHFPTVYGGGFIPSVSTFEEVLSKISLDLFSLGIHIASRPRLIPVTIFIHIFISPPPSSTAITPSSPEEPLAIYPIVAIYPPWWDSVLPKWLVWALFVLVWSTLVFC